MTDKTEPLLRVLICVTGRVAVPPTDLRHQVTAGGAGTKQIEAFNLCDGAHTQTEIIKALALDSGNFSRTVKRWEQRGIVFRLGTGKDERLLHLYPLAD